MIHQALALTASDFITGLLIACALTLVVCIPLLIHKERHDKRETEVKVEYEETWNWPRRNLKGPR